jgi:hypothetical protein
VRGKKKKKRGYVSERAIVSNGISHSLQKKGAVGKVHTRRGYA